LLGDTLDFANVELRPVGWRILALAVVASRSLSFKVTSMIDTVRHAAQNLFRKPDAEEGSNAAKLQEFRQRQALRSRELKLAQKQERLQRRASQLQPA
jgi:predicted component of type VI protein secretion system